MLPPDFPTPGDRYGSAGEGHEDHHQIVLTLDLAAVPGVASDLPLPPDGTLLLFVNADLEPWPAGGGVYVPAGSRWRSGSRPDHEIYGYDSPEELDAELRGVGELRPAPAVSLPSTPSDDETLARHPQAKTLRDVWSDQTDGGEGRQLGGHAADFDDFDDYGDPVAAAAYPEVGDQVTDPSTGSCSRSGWGSPCRSCTGPSPARTSRPAASTGSPSRCTPAPDHREAPGPPGVVRPSSAPDNGAIRPPYPPPAQWSPISFRGVESTLSPRGERP